MRAHERAIGALVGERRGEEAARAGLDDGAVADSRGVRRRARPPLADWRAASPANRRRARAARRACTGARRRRRRGWRRRPGRAAPRTGARRSGRRRASSDGNCASIVSSCSSSAASSDVSAATSSSLRDGPRGVARRSRNARERHVHARRQRRRAAAARRRIAPRPSLASSTVKRQRDTRRASSPDGAQMPVTLERAVDRRDAHRQRPRRRRRAQERLDGERPVALPLELRREHQPSAVGEHARPVAEDLETKLIRLAVHSAAP